MTTPGFFADFPALYAQTARLTQGQPRTFLVVDNERVLFCRSRTVHDSTLGLWLATTTTGTEQLIVDPATIGEIDQLSEADARQRERLRETANGVVSYQLSSRNDVCFVLNQRLFVYNIDTTELDQLPAESPVFDPRFSPDGQHIAYVNNRSLRVINIANSTDRELLAPPSPDVTIGLADFIAAEEIRRQRGFWWSPNSKKLIATSVDQSQVGMWWTFDPSAPSRAPQSLRYPTAGSPNSVTSLLVVDLTSEAPITTFELGEYEYLVDVTWPAGRGPIISRQQRDQTSISIDEINIDKTTFTNLHRLSNQHWVDVVAGTPSVTDAGLVTVENQHHQTKPNGYRALCLNGEPLTDETIDVKSVVSTTFAEAANPTAVITAWKPPIDTAIVLVDLTDGSSLELPLPPGTLSATAGANQLVITERRRDQPGIKVHATRFDNDKLTASTPISTTTHQTGLDLNPYWFSLQNGQVEGVVFLPSVYDPAELAANPGHGVQLPVLVDSYGGPHARRVINAHDSHLTSQWFAEAGYAVVVIDGRGTPGRGPGWEHQVWGDLATPVLEDQLLGLDHVAGHLNCLDLERVAIRGWSFGGYLAALAILREPERFHCAIAGAPVTSWRLYDTHYTERYLGHPDQHPDHYDNTDLVHMVRTLASNHPKRDFLLIHGLADDNVVAGHTTQLSTALLAAGYPHNVLPLSGVTHMTPQTTVAKNLLRLQLDFVSRSLGSTTRP